MNWSATGIMGVGILLLSTLEPPMVDRAVAVGSQAMHIDNATISGFSSSSRSDAGSVRPQERAAAQQLAYLQNGELYIEPIDGGAPRRLAVPWAVNGFSWSPDGTALAVKRDPVPGLSGAFDLGVVQLGSLTVRMIASGVWTASRGATVETAWSPNGRYLAYSVIDDSETLPTSVAWLWDTRGGARRLITSNLTTSEGELMWAPDAHHLALAEGGYNRNAFPHSANPAAVVLDVARSDTPVLRTLGVPLSWSPDGRFLALHRDTGCTYHGCFGATFLAPMSGGAQVSVGPYAEDTVSGTWRVTASGYDFDRWVLGRDGRVLRTLLGEQRSILLSWSPDGRFALAQIYRVIGSSLQPQNHSVVGTGQPACGANRADSVTSQLHI